jgi:hypothetical protein
MNVILSSLFIVLFCIDYYFIYSDTIKCNSHLSERQRAHILSIKASTTLFLLSVYFNYKFMNAGFDTDVYLSSLSNGDNFILELAVLNLMSYLIMDCYIGYNKYHKYMCTLSGYTHHIAYIFISMSALTINASSFYFLYMIEEFPTIFLSSGNYNKSLRKDNIFGLTFFITRILYHVYLTWKFKSNTMFLILGLLSLGLHTYWFKNWFMKYIWNKYIKKETLEKKDKKE